MNKGMNWEKMLDRQAVKYQNKLALIYQDKKFTYRELNAAINQMGNYLRGLGVKKGDRVCLYLTNTWEHVVAHFGVMKIGAVVIPLNVMYKPYEIKYVFDDAHPAAIITTAELYPNILEVKEACGVKNIIITGDDVKEELSFSNIFNESEKLAESTIIDEREDIAFILYTSGTTGTPKGAMMTYHNVFTNIRVITNIQAYDDTDNQIVVLPLFHSFAIFCLYYSLYTGGTVVLIKRYDAEAFLAAVDRYRITVFSCVPPMLLGILKVQNPERFELNSLRWCLCGAAVMPVEVMQKIKERIGVDVVDGYGMTECYHFITTPYPGSLYRYGSIGIPIPSQEVRIVDDHDQDVPTGEVGEIITRGPGVMKGYWNNPDGTEEAIRNGWLHTGDLAKQDEDGYVFIAGRKKDMIIASGFNIYPKEIEEVLYQHPAVADAAVIGVPHAYRGETVKAVCVLKSGMTATTEEIISYCRSTIANFKVPEIVEFRSELPRNASGKVLKRVLKDESQ